MQKFITALDGLHPASPPAPDSRHRPRLQPIAIPALGDLPTDAPRVPGAALLYKVLPHLDDMDDLIRCQDIVRAPSTPWWPTQP